MGEDGIETVRTKCHPLEVRMLFRFKIHNFYSQDAKVIEVSSLHGEEVKGPSCLSQVKVPLLF